MIYILLYKEFELACEFQSLFAKTSLEGRNAKNIKILRHPLALFSFWAHHEKLVVIDQKIAFVGGLDIAYGRFDTNKHLISDLPDEENKVMFPGPDYSNERISVLTGFDKYNICRFQRESTQRMPFHDVSMKVEGEVVNDLVRHFIVVNLNSTGIMLNARIWKKKSIMKHLKLYLKI